MKINEFKVPYDPTLELEKHYSRHFGRIEKIMRIESDECPELDVDVEIYSYPSNPSRPYLTLATSGMSDECQYWPEHLRGVVEERTELLFYTRNIDPWKVQALHNMALYPFKAKTYFTFGSTYKTSGSIGYDANSGRAFLLVPPSHEAISFNTFFNWDEHVQFLWTIPITEKELEYATSEHGKNFLYNIFAQKPLDFFLDDDRKSVV